MRALLLILMTLLLTACGTFLPYEKHPHRVCTDRQAIHDDADSTHVLAWAIVCYTVWRTPGIDTTSAEGAADVEVTDSTVTLVP
jgi:hypothetical protein